MRRNMAANLSSCNLPESGCRQSRQSSNQQVQNAFFQDECQPHKHITDSE